MKQFLIIILFFFFTSCSIKIPPYLDINEVSIANDNYLSDFKQINTIVKDKYSHLENKKIDIDSLSRKFTEAIAEINTKQEYILTLQEYFYNLRNSHSGLYLKPFVIKASAKRIEGRVFINVVKEKAFLEAGVKKCDEIIRVDDVPVLLWLKNKEKYISASTPHDLKESALRKLFRSEIKKKRKFEIKTSNGVKTITVELSELSSTSSNNGKHIFVKGKIINDSIGYIEILRMKGDVKKQFEELYKKMYELPSLIIDVRRNGGGNSRNSENIAEYLLKSSKKASVSRAKLRPNSNAYKGNLCILIGPYTFSAAESFVIDLKGEENTVLIGTQTAGDTGNMTQFFTTDNGLSFRIPTRKPPRVSPDGFPMEGIGIKPNFEVELTIEDYFKGTDTVLEFAIDYLNESH